MILTGPTLFFEQIHKATMNRSTAILYLCLMYRLSLESGVEILHQLDQLIEAQHTLDHSLIKVEENLVSLRQSQPPLIPKIFTPALLSEGS